ncbi:MAG: LacI family DNA-binding transcriptional regulator [Kiloniellales bacterium]|nr:LacI family DNA-binding transcriptional regulator [Kiloniellales bacterium]
MEAKTKIAPKGYESAIVGAGLRAPTMEDVARAAGVSPATVSRCINRPERVREDRRLRIRAAIAELGYVPHGAARALASKRSMTVGALFPRLNSLLFGSYIAPLQRSLQAEGYTLVVSSSDYDPATEHQQVSSLVSNGVDGLVLIGTSHDPEVFALLERKAIPFVLTWAWDQGYPHPQIGFCNATAAATVANYLLDIGHRRIGMISGPAKDNDRADARIRGVREALAARGCDLPARNLVESRFDVKEGGKAFAQLMRQPDPPTAVLSGSDIFALGAVFEARRLGLSVPADVSITGFDDTDLASCVVPALTSLRTPRAEMAELTAAHLLDRLAGRETGSHRLETELIVRESSAPPTRQPTYAYTPSHKE